MPSRKWTGTLTRVEVKSAEKTRWRGKEYNHHTLLVELDCKTGPHTFSLVSMNRPRILDFPIGSLVRVSGGHDYGGEVIRISDYELLASPEAAEEAQQTDEEEEAL